MRFRKSITICKGVKLNISTSGVSATIGRKGISANVGKQGVFLNTSLPGTGISDRRRLLNFGIAALQDLTVGGINVSQALGISKPSGKTGARKTAGAAQADVPQSFQLDMAEDGTISVYDEDGMLIGDAAVLAKIKRLPAYLKMEEQLRKAQLDAFNAVTVFVNIGQLSEDVIRAGDFERALRESKLETVPIPDFPEAKPTREEVQAMLVEEAQKTVRSFFNVERKREEYVRTHLAEQYEAACAEWQDRKAEWEAEQAEALEAENERLAEQHEQRMEQLREGLDGSEEGVENAIAGWLEGIALPIEFDVEFEYDAENGVLLVDMDLPEIEDLPTEKMVELASGKLKTKDKTQKELKQEYVRCVLGLAMFCASSFFNCSPAMKRILMSGYTQRRDARTGETQNVYIYSVRFDRGAFERPGYQKKDPMDFVSKFPSRINLSGTGELEEITPYGAEDLGA